MSAAEASQKIGDTVELSIALIVPDPKNRKKHDKTQLQALAESIAAEGLLQPIVVRPTGETEKTENGPRYCRFMIIAGERRWLAHKLLKRATIPARITAIASVMPTSADVRARAAENFQREDLTPIEEARLFRELHVDHKIPQAEIAKIRGRGNQSTVANSLRLLELPNKLQELVQVGALSRAHAIPLVRFSRWPKICLRMAEIAITQGTPSKELESSDVPFASRLERDKLIVDINPWSYGGLPDYTIPEQYKSDPAWVRSKDHRAIYCLEPEKWPAEKAKQDATFSQRKKTAEKAETAKQSKMSPAAKAARQKKIADNKRNRLATAEARTKAIDRLKGLKEIDKRILAMLLEKVLRDQHYRGRVTGAAKDLGIMIPKGLVTSSYYTLISYNKLLDLTENDLVRLAAGAVMTYHAEDALKYSNGVPEEIERILPKVKGGRK